MTSRRIKHRCVISKTNLCRINVDNMSFKHTDVLRATFVLLLAVITASEGVSTQDTHIKHADQKTFINQSVTLSCHASVEGPVNWWYRSSPSAVVVELCVNGNLINGNRAKFILDSVSYSLTIPNPTFKDSGTYTCVENSGIGTRHVTELTVTVPLRQYQPLLVVAGHNATVPCHSTTLKPINWQTRGGSDALDKDIYIGGEFVEVVSNKYHLYPSTYDLIITGVTSTEEGIYTCVEDSGFGTKHSTRLIVKASGDTENRSTTSPRDSTYDSNNNNNWSKTSIILFTVIGVLCVLLASLIIIAAVMHMKVSALRLRACRVLVEPQAGEPLLPTTEDKATQKTVKSLLELMGRKVDEAVQCTIGNMKKESRPSVLSVRFARQSSYDDSDRQRHVSK